VGNPFNIQANRYGTKPLNMMFYCWKKKSER